MAPWWWGVAWFYAGTKTTTRKSYREIQGVEVSSGFCCGTECCGPKYKINGLTLIPREHRGHFSTLKEMLGEISTRSNEARFGKRDVV